MSESEQEKISVIEQPTEEQERELRENSLERIRPILQELDNWRNESLSSAFRF